jgi:cyanate permease
MTRLVAFLALFWRQPDKVLHVLIGAAVAGPLALLAAVLLPGWVQPRAVAPGALMAALWLCALLAWVKERRDKLDPLHHTWDGWDAFATVIGGLAGATVAAWILATL